MCRGGSLNKAIEFYNVGGRNSWFDQNPESFISETLKPSVTFLSETWLTKPQYTELAPQIKEHFHVEAVRKKNRPGRSSGGMEALISKNINGKVITSARNHIGVAFANVYVVSFYLKPTMEFDDKVTDIVTALDKAPRGFELIIGGDFNIKPQEPEFTELRNLLDEEYGIYLASDPKIPTYYYTKKVQNPQTKIWEDLPASSTVDHIFCTEGLNVTKTSVGPLTGSDHCPTSIVIKVKRNLLRKRNIAQEAKGFVKPAAFSEALKEHESRFANLTPKEQIAGLNNLISSLNKAPSKSKKKKNHYHKEWYSEYLSSLRKIMLNHRCNSMKNTSSHILHSKYLIARRAYNAACKKAKEEFEKKKMENMIEVIKTEGMSALYKLMKGSSSNSYVDPESFLQHLEELYNPVQDTDFPEVHGCERDSTILTSPITKEETETVIKTLDSKAIANMGVSPIERFDFTKSIGKS